mgnify:FL=1
MYLALVRRACLIKIRVTMTKTVKNYTLAAGYFNSQYTELSFDLDWHAERMASDFRRGGQGL